MNIEEQVREFLREHNCWQARRADAWVKAYGDIVIAWAEFTGGYMSRETMDNILSRSCFCVDYETEEPKEK